MVMMIPGPFEYCFMLPRGDRVALVKHFNEVSIT